LEQSLWPIKVLIENCPIMLAENGKELLIYNRNTVTTNRVAENKNANFIVHKY